MPVSQAFAQPAAPAVSPSRGQRVAGRVVSGFAAAFLIFDGAARAAGFAPYVEGTVRSGFPAEVGPWLGAVLIASTLLYVFPATALLGAILITAYLGGATATHLRLGDPLFFPVVFGAVVWAGLVLRDPRLRALLPLRRTSG